MGNGLESNRGLSDMHDWSDEWFDKYGNDLYTAQNFIYDYVKKYTRCSLMSKEKYGTIRYEYIFPPCGGLFHGFCIRLPFRTRTKFKFNGETVTLKPARKVIWSWNSSWLYRKWCLLGWYVAGIAIKKAIKRWPHLETELCCDFLAPTKFGRECETKYWKEC